MSNLHVLIVPSWYPTPVAPIAGIFFREQAQVLCRAGARVGVAYPELRSLRTLSQGDWSANRFQVTWSDEEGVPTLRYHGWAPPKLMSWQNRMWVWRALALVERYVARHGRPQLVHAHGVRLAGSAGRVIRERLGLPYVLTEHASAFARGALRDWERHQIAVALQGAAQVMAVSPAMAVSLRPHVGDRPVAIVPNLANTNFFALPPTRRSAPPFRFLTVAALTPRKAVDLLIQAFAEAFYGQSDVLLDVGGDGPERAMLVRLADNLGIRPQVHFLGPLSRPQVREAMWRAHRFVLTSPWESFSVVLVEAMATGLRVVATRSGGPESIVNEEVGRLVPVGRPEALAMALLEEFAAGPLEPVQESGIREHVDRRFGPAAFTERLFRYYRAAIEPSASQPTVVQSA